MVHYRFNETAVNPNPHVNFISALHASEPGAQERARQLLRALAAQVKPVMKDHGFTVNSLEEYQYNKVFAGRNWENGSVVELVLRRPDGGFAPNSWLMSTLCHELAHIKHMNHGPDFQKLWTQLQNEVRALQAKGYFGDGMWSSGKRLADSAVVSGGHADIEDLPEYMCGGAQSRARPPRRRRRRQPAAGPSRHTGAQTAKRRKAGSRVTAAGTFEGNGRALNADIEDAESKKAGAGFRKQATSKRAREERALAAERRMRALQGKASSPRPNEQSADSDSGDESDDVEESAETDQDRMRTMLESMAASDTDGLRSGTLADYWGDIVVVQSKRPPGNTNNKANEISLVTGGMRQSTLDSQARSSSSRRDTKLHKPLGLGSSVREEMNDRKKESLGLNARRVDRVLGAKPSDSLRATLGERQGRSTPQQQEMWSCLVCTLDNLPEHLVCSACGTPRGEAAWRESNP